MLQLLTIPFLIYGAAFYSVSPRENSVLCISGPDFLAPLAQDLAKQLQKETPVRNFKYNPTDTAESVQALISGQCDVALITRPLNEEEFRAAVAGRVFPFLHPVAYDCLVIIVYPENDARNIRIDHLRKMYQERVRSWKYNGWKDVSVLPVSQSANSGAHDLFTYLVMQEEDWLQKYHRIPERDEKTVAGKVQVNWGAIGYVGPRTPGRHVKKLTVEGIKCTPENIRSGKYPLSGPVFFLTRGWPQPGSILHAFVRLPFTKSGQQIIENNGFTPLTEY